MGIKILKYQIILTMSMWKIRVNVIPGIQLHQYSLKKITYLNVIFFS